jgi:uncharacterized membrane protein YdjX (TVP38/TMEM64 family)
MGDKSTGEHPGKVSAFLHRHALLLKGCSLLLIAVSLVLMTRRLPLLSSLHSLQEWIAGFGVWGPLVFGLIYVLAALLLLPASALTMAAGAIFGLAVGTLTTSLAGTATAALAFAIARTFGRSWVLRKIERHSRFIALDRAVRESGWRIVALLRLSPAVPFTLQNYLYGLTGIRFWPYLTTSWLAMLPGGFLYVYLGSIGRAGLEAAGGESSRSPGEWAMMIVGLLATVAATVYLARLARHALRQQVVLVEESMKESMTAEGWPWSAIVLACIALAALAVAVFAI